MDGNTPHNGDGRSGNGPNKGRGSYGGQGRSDGGSYSRGGKSFGQHGQGNRGYGSRDDRDARGGNRGYGKRDDRGGNRGYGKRDDRGPRNDRNDRDGHGQRFDRDDRGSNRGHGADRRNDRGYGNRNDRGGNRGYGKRDDRGPRNDRGSNRDHGNRNGRNGYGDRNNRGDRNERRRFAGNEEMNRAAGEPASSGQTRKSFGSVSGSSSAAQGKRDGARKPNGYRGDKRDNRGYGNRDDRGGNRGGNRGHGNRDDRGPRDDRGYDRHDDRGPHDDRGGFGSDQRGGRFDREDRKPREERFERNDGFHRDDRASGDPRDERRGFDKPNVRRQGDRRPYSGPNPDRRTSYSRGGTQGGRWNNGGHDDRRASGMRGRDRFAGSDRARNDRFDHAGGHKTHKQLRDERRAEREAYGEGVDEFFASCAFGFEALLGEELERLGCQGVRPLQGGVSFYGDEECAYRVCLWSRLASRVLKVVARIGAGDAQELYDGAKEITWGKYLTPDGTIAINTRGTNRELRNTAFVAQKVKDAICDRMRAKLGKRPDVQPHRPDLNIRITIHGGSATVYIDYAGEPLNQRAYRSGHETVEAPLKESLAASVLAWAGWTDQDERAFFDPCCGSGTFVIEGAMVASDKAPGLMRDYWGFAGLRTFQPEIWDKLIDEAEKRFEEGKKRLGLFVGSDIDPTAIEAARACAKKAGFGDELKFAVADCAQMRDTLAAEGFDFQDAQAAAFLAINPPYGQRLLPEGLDGYYEQLREGLTGLPAGWEVAVITADELFDTEVGIDAQQAAPFYNGNIEVTARLLETGHTFLSECTFVDLAGNDVTVPSTSEHVDQFAARFRKVAKARRKWAAAHDVHAYRIYDADLPDYALAIDLYEDAETGDENLLVTEYQAPAEIDPQQAARRANDACTVAGVMLGIPEERVFTRVRRQARGGSQYAKDERANHDLLVKENGHQFEVDLEGYLDTGLFLDHRITRQLVGEMAKGKRFLNLFAYTGSATVYAAAGEAASTTTVDLSQTYLNWAQRNMERAGFTGDEHVFIKTDVLGWLEDRAQMAAMSDDGIERDPEQEEGSGQGMFDLVFFDAPTFSNSKSMGERTWDIQRDYLDALGSLRALLPVDARVVFSGNYRRFKLDEEAVREAGFAVKDITKETIPEDFLRNPRIHFCYVLRAL